MLLTIAVITALLVSCQTEEKKVVSYKVDDAVSKAEWKGSAPDHFHVGSFKVTGLLIANKDGVIQSGDFIIPIVSIEDFDLPGNVKPALLADLKDNFFKIAVHPDAKFHITSSSPYHSADTTEVKDANCLITGDFNMVGQTHTISFPAKITTTKDGVSTEAKFNIDRTKWGIKNYSDPSQKLYILPDVNIKLNVHAEKTA